MAKKYIIVLGPPGSGKGTQAKTIAKELNYLLFGAGDLMRVEAESGSELGNKFKEIWARAKGELIPEELVQQLVGQVLSEYLMLNRGIVFDGYPRTIAQADILTNILRSTDVLVLNLRVKEEELIKRLSTRKICDKCQKIFFKPDENGIKKCDDCDGKLVTRQEDSPEVIKERLEVYADRTAPLIEFYQKLGYLTDVDGNPPIREVTKEIKTILEKQK